MRQDSLPFYEIFLQRVYYFTTLKKLDSCFRNYDLFERDSFDGLQVY